MVVWKTNTIFSAFFWWNNITVSFPICWNYLVLLSNQQQQQTSSYFSTSFCQFVSHSQAEKMCFFWLTEKNTCWGEQVSLLLLGKLKNRNSNGQCRKRALSFQSASQSVSQTVSRTTFLVCNVDFFFSTETFFNWHWTFTMFICVLVCVLFRFLYFEVLRKKRGIVCDWFFLIC